MFISHPFLHTVAFHNLETCLREAKGSSSCHQLSRCNLSLAGWVPQAAAFLPSRHGEEMDREISFPQIMTLEFCIIVWEMPFEFRNFVKDIQDHEKQLLKVHDQN